MLDELKELFGIKSKGKKEPLLILKEHPELKLLYENHEQALKFFEKKLMGLQKEHKDMHRTFWDNVGDYLKSINIYRKSPMGFTDGVLYRYEGE